MMKQGVELHLTSSATWIQSIEIPLTGERIERQRCRSIGASLVGKTARAGKPRTRSSGWRWRWREERSPLLSRRVPELQVNLKRLSCCSIGTARRINLENIENKTLNAARDLTEHTGHELLFSLAHGCRYWSAEAQGMLGEMLSSHRLPAHFIMTFKDSLKDTAGGKRS